MRTIIDIRYTTITNRKYRNMNLIRCFAVSVDNKSYLKHLDRLLLRDDVIKITVEKYEVDN